jgi:hypothetical protein
LQQALQSFEVMGPNSAMMGKKDGNESGRAIMAQQQGGSIQVGPIVDALREMDMETYRKVWRRIRQFWTGQTWVRVTDDLNNMKWVEINKPAQRPMMRPALDPETGQAVMQPAIDPATGQPAMEPVIDPATGQPVMENSVADLDVDIEISDAPDMGTLQQEEFSNLIELAKIGVVMPPKVYLAASNLRNKGELVQMLDDASQQQQQVPPEQQQAIRLELQGKEVENAKGAADIQLKQAQSAKLEMEARMAPIEFERSQQEQANARNERIAFKRADMERQPPSA